MTCPGHCYSRSLSGWSHTPNLTAPLLATAVGLTGAAAGLRLTEIRGRARIMVPFSAGVLLGVALFGLLPELAAGLGWIPSAAMFAAGYFLLLLIDRYVYPVCPSCSHDHDHATCSTELHGFAVPLIAAAAMHSFLDGWNITTVQLMPPLGLRIAVPLAIAIHKAPEGIALGGVLMASISSPTRALVWCFVAEGTTLLGSALALTLAPRLGSQWITYPLGVTAGWLAYLGYHAIHEESKRRGAGFALSSALTGMAGAALLQRGVEAILR